MSTAIQPLLEPRLFIPLANLVTRYGLVNLVETGTGPASSGMEAASRLGLHGYTCDVYEPCVLRVASLYPQFDAYHGNSLSMFNEILPKLEGPTFFWLDGHCPTDQTCVPGGIFPPFDEMQLIRKLKRGFERDVLWLDDIAMIIDPANPVAVSWDVDLRGERWYGENEHKWSEYLAVMADTHDAFIDTQEGILKLTPRG